LAVVVDDAAPAAADNAGLLLATARFVDEGETAGVNPLGATACGVAVVEGRAGAAVRAVSDVSSDACFGVHQAQLGPDWQPVIPATMMARIKE
jgi:hypothetical protein